MNDEYSIQDIHSYSVSGLHLAQLTYSFQFQSLKMEHQMMLQM